MAFCRVFSKPDGSVRVMHPNPRLKPEGESDEDFCRRICDMDMKTDKTLDGLLYVDVDKEKLPPRTMADIDGEKVSLRHAWKVQGDKIMVDEEMTKK